LVLDWSSIGPLLVLYWYRLLSGENPHVADIFGRLRRAGDSTRYRRPVWATRA
jgi:hypothetical protein